MIVSMKELGSARLGSAELIQRCWNLCCSFCLGRLGNYETICHHCTTSIMFSCHANIRSAWRDRGGRKRWSFHRTMQGSCFHFLTSHWRVLQKKNDQWGAVVESKNGEVEEFNPTPEECKTVSQWLTKNHPQLLESFDESEPFFKWLEKDAFKPIVLLPSKLKCCGSRGITIRNRPSFPVVYTSHGTNVAASFNGKCKTFFQLFSFSLLPLLEFIPLYFYATIRFMLLWRLEFA